MSELTTRQQLTALGIDYDKLMERLIAKYTGTTKAQDARIRNENTKRPLPNARLDDRIID